MVLPVGVSISRRFRRSEPENPLHVGLTRDFPMILRTITGDSGFRAPKPIRRLPAFSPGRVPYLNSIPVRH